MQLNLCLEWANKIQDDLSTIDSTRRPMMKYIDKVYIYGIYSPNGSKQKEFIHSCRKIIFVDNNIFRLIKRSNSYTYYCLWWYSHIL